MMRTGWSAAVLLAVSSNLDNLGVGVAYALRGVRVPFSANALIAAVTGASTLAAILAGAGISSFLQPRHASLLGSALLIALGFWITFSEYTKRGAKEAQVFTLNHQFAESSFLTSLSLVLKNPSCADQDSSQHIDNREALLLACALAMNNVANGVAAGILHVPAIFMTSWVMILSMLMLLLGLQAGHLLAARLMGELTGVISGLLLVAIGILQLVL